MSLIAIKSLVLVFESIVRRNKFWVHLVPDLIDLWKKTNVNAVTSLP